MKKAMICLFAVFAMCLFVMAACGDDEGDKGGGEATQNDGGNGNNDGGSGNDGGGGGEDPCVTNLDPSKVWIDRGTIATGGPILVGEDGATDPGATVTVTDPEGNSLTGTANEDGGFGRNITSLRLKKGCKVKVKVQKDGCEPTEMTLTFP